MQRNQGLLCTPLGSLPCTFPPSVHDLPPKNKRGLSFFWLTVSSAFPEQHSLCRLFCPCAYCPAWVQNGVTLWDMDRDLVDCNEAGARAVKAESREAVLRLRPNGRDFKPVYTSRFFPEGAATPDGGDSRGAPAADTGAALGSGLRLRGAQGAGGLGQGRQQFEDLPKRLAMGGTVEVEAVYTVLDGSTLFASLACQVSATCTTYMHLIHKALRMPSLCRGWLL